MLNSITVDCRNESVDPMSQAFVSIGKPECDFIVRDSEMNYAYIQVAMTIMNSLETENREYLVHTTDYYEPGLKVGLKFGPDDIHVMYRMDWE